jgi:hypothetical protein
MGMRVWLITLTEWGGQPIQWRERNLYTEALTRDIVKARYPNWQSLTVKEVL